VSDFVDSLQDINKAIEHPHRRVATVLQPGGRFVEVTVMGHPQGDVIVTVANPSNYTFNATIEQRLYDNELQIVSICPPGCGDTSLPLATRTRLDQLADDVCAVLAQMGIKQCLMMAYNANTVYAFADGVESC